MKNLNIKYLLLAIAVILLSVILVLNLFEHQKNEVKSEYAIDLNLINLSNVELEYLKLDTKDFPQTFDEIFKGEDNIYSVGVGYRKGTVFIYKYKFINEKKVYFYEFSLDKYNNVKNYQKVKFKIDKDKSIKLLN